MSVNVRLVLALIFCLAAIVVVYLGLRLGAECAAGS